MELQIASHVNDLPSNSVVVVPFFKGETAGDAREIPAHQKNALDRLIQGGARIDRAYETTLLLGDDNTPPVCLVGIGERQEAGPLQVFRALSAATRYVTGRGFTGLAVVERDGVAPAEFVVAAVEGAIAGAYNLALRKTGERTERRLESLSIISQSPENRAREAATLGQIVGESRNAARDLVNLPPNEITPTSLAERARELASQYSLQFEVLDQDEMQRLGMGSLLGVAAGSRQPPRLIVLRYGDRNAATRLAFVGKGLTFDSGGLSLKTAQGMETMKSDMSGAAAVIAGMSAVARLAPPGISVTGYVGATENMPGGEAMRPGDILTAMNGKTIEVLNTDAEGRLVLADVLAYAVSEGATHIVDFATLTGAAYVALGSAASLGTGKPMAWVERVVGAADRALERAWPMPQYPEYREAMDSRVADLKNTGGRGGGALNAAAFLSEFVGDVPWAHMDIAGTAFLEEPQSYRDAGATGEGVGTIVGLVQDMAGSTQ